MSSCCCLNSPCPVRTPPNPFGATAHRAGEGKQLVPSTAEEVVDYLEYATSRTEMDVALLREQYRLTKENKMRQNRVVVFRRATPDPWHDHLALHRCPSTPPVVTLSPPEQTSNAAGSNWPPPHRRHSEAGSFKPKNKVERYVDSAAGLKGSCPNISSKDPLSGCVHMAGACQLDGFLKIAPREEGGGESLTGTSEGFSFEGSFTSLEESYTPPGCSLTPSACSSVADPYETEDYDKPLEGSHGGYGLACPAFGRLAAPVPTPNRSQSFGVQPLRPTLVPDQHHFSTYYPFPNRRSIKKSEAAKKLGMYSSF
ncbi:uncharacterized protein LOC130376967 isoform X2 [Gadus chalcogrammus]|uniref:uncharacterized protein LOC130376967 isoform X2 n=1 Tax=Gadus chalcogrammus TaxID=1042646 RepID=UPI0024C4E4CC|nr:uncharacterized protein LOC130376967 isoform X2 [Gadus chalcogrammus]